jgi:hypothetical protein
MRIILVRFKDRLLGEYECYSSLKPFFEQYPQYDELKDKIDYQISRKKQPYKHVDFELQWLNVRRSLNGA